MKKQNDLAKRKLKILIVDDLEFPRMVIRNMFHDLGFESHNNILEEKQGTEPGFHNAMSKPGRLGLVPART